MRSTRHKNSPPSHTRPTASTSNSVYTSQPFSFTTSSTSSPVQHTFGSGINDTGYNTELAAMTTAFSQNSLSPSGGALSGFNLSNGGSPFVGTGLSPVVCPAVTQTADLSFPQPLPLTSGNTFNIPTPVSTNILTPVSTTRTGFRSSPGIYPAVTQTADLSALGPGMISPLSTQPLPPSSGNTFSPMTHPTSVSSTGSSSRTGSTSRSSHRHSGRSSGRRTQGFEEIELQKIRNLSRLLGQLHVSTSECRRIQRGPPGAGSLSMSMSQSKADFNKVKAEISSILTKHNHLPGIGKLITQFNLFDVVVNDNINERGYDDGYTDRVRYLEKMNYECGQLKGMLDIVLEGIWISGGNEPVARALTFNDEEELLGIQFEDNFEVLLSSDSNYQQGDINVDLTLTTNLCSNLLKFMDSNTDVTFRIGSKRICAHRVILAAQSEYFKSLLFGSMRESEPNSEIVLQDISMATLQLLIRYAYCGRVQLASVSIQGLLRLLEAADRFSFISLKDALVSQLSSLISVERVIPLLLSAHQLNITKLHESCLQVADKNALAVIKSEALMTMPCDRLAEILNRDTFVVEELLIYNAVSRWMSHNYHLQCAELVQCVRLTQMPQQDLLDFTDEDNGMFTDSDVLQALKIQMKPLWEQMKPRGRKDKKNLFQSQECAKIIDSKVNWKSCSQNVRSPLIASAHAENVLFQGTPNVALCNAIISSQQQFQHTLQFGLNPSTAPLHQEMTFVVGLDAVYLIDNLKFEPYENNEKLGFSYTLEISTNKTDWKILIDYSRYTCYGRQTLLLPVISLRYLRFKLCGVVNSSVPFTLVLKECSLREHHSDSVIIRQNGIQAPQAFESFVTIQEWSLNERSEHVCTAKLQKPVLAKRIRLKLDGSCDSNTVGDIVLYVNNDTSESQTLKNVLIKRADGIDISLAEDSVVCEVHLKIINVVAQVAASMNFRVTELLLKSEII